MEDNHTELKALGNKPLDYLVSLTKAMAGSAPVVGSVLSEFIGVIVPEQRIDRIARYCEHLEQELRTLGNCRENLREAFNDEEFADIFEEGLRQAGHALTDERKQYIACLVANSMSQEAISRSESRYFLKILNDLSDIEIIWLCFYNHASSEFVEKHMEILHAEYYYSIVDPLLIEKQALKEHYIDRLVKLSLLKIIDSEECDILTKKPKITYKLSSIGKLLLTLMLCRIDFRSHGGPNV